MEATTEEKQALVPPVATAESDSDRSSGSPPPLPRLPLSKTAASFQLTPDMAIIERNKTARLDAKLTGKDKTKYSSSIWLIADDTLDFITAGVEAIIADDVTQCFRAEKLPSWNLLTRNRRAFQKISWRLWLVWLAGLFVRYLLLMPVRVCVFVIFGPSTVVICLLVHVVPGKERRKWLGELALRICFRTLSHASSCIVYFHDQLEALFPGRLQCFSQWMLSRVENHIWFNRQESDDRKAVSTRMRSHVAEPKNAPLLIFPEGVCVNNTSVMMFKKGAFELDCPIYPIAIKYDARLGDAFWDSQDTSYAGYLWHLVTSWAIVANVWYLPPMKRLKNEDACEFAHRVKRAIAEKAGLVDLEWNGMLKREKVSRKLIESHQRRYYKRLREASSICRTPKKDGG